MHIKKLKKYYFINDFNPIHLKDLDKNIELIWRSDKKENDLKKVYKLANYCKRNKIKLFLSNNIKLALKLKLNGAYISSYNKEMRFNCYQYKKDFELLGSSHNLIEIDIKKKQKIKKIFISPIFKHKRRYAMGIHKCRYFFDDKSYEKIALGGISEVNVNLILISKFIGFAGINFFKKKAPNKLGP
tara:strand:- start:219 stop:776 length:558 start_codon:yes stop_codon:yes gene_type:complete